MNKTKNLNKQENKQKINKYFKLLGLKLAKSLLTLLTLGIPQLVKKISDTIEKIENEDKNIYNYDK